MFDSNKLHNFKFSEGNLKDLEELLDDLYSRIYTRDDCTFEDEKYISATSVLDILGICWMRNGGEHQIFWEE